MNQTQVAALIAELNAMPAGLYSCDANGSACTSYVAQWKVVELVEKHAALAQQAQAQQPTPPAPQVPAPVDERIEEAFPPPTPIDSEELDAWVCDHCNGGGWHWQEHQVGERKTDVQQLKTHCDKCEGLGYCGPDAEARAALQSTAPQTKGQP